MVTTNSAISAITRLIGEPQNYVLAPDGSWHMIYDTAYITRAILLVLFMFALIGILLSFVKSFGRGRR